MQGNLDNNISHSQTYFSAKSTTCLTTKFMSSGKCAKVSKDPGAYFIRAAL
jgi:hypothetical protein